MVSVQEKKKSINPETWLPTKNMLSLNKSAWMLIFLKFCGKLSLNVWMLFNNIGKIGQWEK